MKKAIRFLCAALSLIIFCSGLTACGKTLKYKGSVLAAGKVGAAYEQSVELEKAPEGVTVTYELKEGSVLPSGLSWNAAGLITGTPVNKTSSPSVFTFIASAEGLKSVEAEFSIPSIEEGTLAYTLTDLPNSAPDREYDQQIAVSGGAGAVTYTLKSGDLLPAGLSFDNGAITGTPTTLGETRTFTVTASANDCKSVTSDFTIKVVEPWIDYEGTKLVNGRVGVYYNASLATATGADVITYGLKAGSTLPSGLSLSSKGTLSGTPDERLSGREFTIVASAAGYVSVEAVFRINILPAIEGFFDGVITYNPKAISTVYVNESIEFKEAVSGATASNRMPVSYALAPGSTLPGDLEILPNGTLSSENGAPAAGTFTFNVVAGAQGCESVTASFTLTVAFAKLKFPSGRLEIATVGTSYTRSIANAVTPDGINVPITYTVKSGIPAGLSVSPGGQLSGTPAKSSKEATFSVTASAEGYTSVDAYFYMRIQEKITPVANGIFEAEYIDLTGITGEGWSGSRFEEGVIQNDSPDASNGYFIGWTLGRNIYTFNFTSSQAVTGAGLKVRIASEGGNVNITPAAFEIRVNGISLPYTSFQLSGTYEHMGDFVDCVVAASGLNLVAGNNKVELVIKENNILDGRCFGPAMDCIKIENFGAASFTWRPCTYNTDWI